MNHEIYLLLVVDGLHTNLNKRTTLLIRRLWYLQCVEMTHCKYQPSRGDPSNTLVNHIHTNFSTTISPMMMILSAMECWQSPLHVNGNISVNKGPWNESCSTRARGAKWRTAPNLISRPPLKSQLKTLSIIIYKQQLDFVSQVNTEWLRIKQ